MNTQHNLDIDQDYHLNSSSDDSSDNEQQIEEPKKTKSSKKVSKKVSKKASKKASKKVSKKASKKASKKPKRKRKREEEDADENDDANDENVDANTTENVDEVGSDKMTDENDEVKEDVEQPVTKKRKKAAKKPKKKKETIKSKKLEEKRLKNYLDVQQAITELKKKKKTRSHIVHEQTLNNYKLRLDKISDEELHNMLKEYNGGYFSDFNKSLYETDCYGKQSIITHHHGRYLIDRLKNLVVNGRKSPIKILGIVSENKKGGKRIYKLDKDGKKVTTPVIDNDGNPVLGKNGKPKTKYVYTQKDAPPDVLPNGRQRFSDTNKKGTKVLFIGKGGVLINVESHPILSLQRSDIVRKKEDIIETIATQNTKGTIATMNLILDDCNGANVNHTLSTYLNSIKDMESVSFNCSATKLSDKLRNFVNASINKWMDDNADRVIKKIIDDNQ